MPVIQRETSVGAGLTVDNQLNGSAFEFIRVPMLITIGTVASATGGFITIQTGADVVLEESPPIVKATFPVIPDEMIYTDVVTPGDRLIIRLRNPTGGAVVFRTIVQLQPMA